MKTITIKELNIEIETKIHDNGKTFAEAMKSCPKGWRIPTYAELQWLRNSEHRDELGLLDTWEFVKQEDKISEKIGNVAMFLADAGGAILGCIRRPDYSNSSLGVRFVRELKK